MNIGLLIGRFPPDLIGGAELQTKQLATELARRGHDVTIFTRRYSGRPYRQRQDGYLIRRRNELPVPGLRMVWDTIPALCHIASHRPRLQVLLCYQTLNSGLIGVIAQSLFGIPAVLSVRGNREYRLHDSMTNRLLVPAIYRRARYLVVQSSRILDDLHTQLRSAGQTTLSDQLQHKTAVIPNGIRVPSSVRSSGAKILYVGRLIKDKGVADLVLAMKHLPGAEALIVGDGPERERLESLAEGMPVTFVGQVMPSAVADHLEQARALVLPSYQGDGLPNVILEAMASGAPVIATHTAGIPDLVRHEETGFLFEPGDIQQMVFYVDRVLRDDDLWRSLGERGLETARAYSWDVITPRIEQLLLNTISQ